MNRRTITACAMAFGFLTVSGRVALAQQHHNDYAQGQLPAGWIQNWDGSGTYVFLGSPGTGNVGYTAGSFDVSQAHYSARHPGWHDQLMAQVTQGWYQDNRGYDGAGWREQDRLTPSMQDRLRRGRPLDRDLRSRMHPLPADLSQRYGPPPRGYRYAVIGGNVVLVDNSYVVHDVFSVTFQTH